MATIIENVVEPVIEDPVVDIFVDLPGNGGTVASRVPALNSGPLGVRGRSHQAGAGVLPEETFSVGADPGKRAADPGLDARPDYLNFPRNSGTVEADGAGPDPGKLPDSRPSPPPERCDFNIKKRHRTWRG